MAFPPKKSKVAAALVKLPPNNNPPPMAMNREPDPGMGGKPLLKNSKVFNRLKELKGQ